MTSAAVLNTKQTKRKMPKTGNIGRERERELGSPCHFFRRFLYIIIIIMQ